MITRAHVMPYMGQPVGVRTHDGVLHRGVLHSVNGDGIYLRRMGAGPRLTGADAADASVELTVDSQLSMPQDAADDVELAWWPFFFLPFAAMAAFGPWGWWW